MIALHKQCHIYRQSGQTVCANAIQNTIDNWYSGQGLPTGSGVHCGDFYNLLRAGFNGSVVTVNSSYQMSTGSQTIIVVGGHAVILQRVSGKSVLYTDPNGGGTGFASVSDIQ